MTPANNDADNARPKTVSFRLPAPLMAELRKLAKANRRTLSGELQIAIEKHLNANGSAGDLAASESNAAEA